MAELLIRVVDKVNDDPEKNAQCSKAGDVIVVCPDGWPWSAAERTEPFWRVVRVPLLQTEIEAALAEDHQSGKLVRRRRWKIDLAALPNAARFSGVRQDEIIELTRQQVASALTLKA